MLSDVSFLQMLGILWLIQVITGRPSSGNDGNRWVLLLSIVELCVPPEKQAALEELKTPNPLIASPLLMTLNLLNVDGLALRLSSLDAMLAAVQRCRLQCS